MDVVIIGAGGFGREVLDVLRAETELAVDSVKTFLGFIDDGAPDPERLARIDARLLGTTMNLRDYSGTGYVVAVGDPRARAQLAQVADHAGLTPVTLIHPTATMGRDVVVGPGAIVCAGVRLTTNIRIGCHVHFNLNTTVGHDTVIEDFVTLNPHASISGDVYLQRGATVGTAASINQGLRVGAEATVGAGAAVVRDVNPESVVVGVPAKPLK